MADLDALVRPHLEGYCLLEEDGVYLFQTIQKLHAACHSISDELGNEIQQNASYTHAALRMFRESSTRTLPTRRRMYDVTALLQLCEYASSGVVRIACVVESRKSCVMHHMCN